MSYSRIIRDRAVEAIAWPKLYEPVEAEPGGEPTEPSLENPPEPEPAHDPLLDLHAELEAVRAEAAGLRAELPRREEAARKQAAEVARAEGLRAGEANAIAQANAAARQEYEDALSHTAQSIRDILESRRSMRKQMEEDLVQLAIAVARRILHRELHVDPEALVGIVKAVVERVEAREIHRILVAPYDLPFVQKRTGELGLPARVELAADGSLVRGSVILETARGRLDASMETQLAEIERGFADLVRRS